MEDKRSAPYIAYRCVQLQAQNRLTMGSKKLLLCFLFLLENVVLSSSQWPYHQIYPPLNESDDRTSLYFAVVLSFGGERVSIGALPGVQIALDHINSQPSIVPGYTLHYTLTNSECKRESALRSYFDHMKNPPTKLGWVGSGCSVATEPTAELTHFYNITQLSCTSSSPELQNRERFRYYFQLLATNLLTAHGFFGIIQHFGWKRIRIIIQDEKVYTATMDVLKQMLEERTDVEYTEVRFRSDEGFGSVRAFDSEIRIYVLAMYSLHAVDVFCEAYRSGFHYPKYIILTFGWYVRNWWKADRLSNCTIQEKASALQYSLATVPFQFPTPDDEHTGEPNITLSEFNDLYYEVVKREVNSNNSLELYNDYMFPYAYHCSEATLAFAYALNKTITDFAENGTLNREAAEQSNLSQGETFTMEKFTYSTSVVVSRMLEHLHNTRFPGISGNDVRFTDKGLRIIDRVRIVQYQLKDNGILLH